MTVPKIDAGSTPLKREVVAISLVAMVIAATAALLFGPVLPLALTGDSYQWIQHAHLAAHRPALLLADLDTFYRPSTTWTLVVDRLVWGGYDAKGYRTTSLALHGMVALALAVAGRRLGLGWIAAAAVAVVWLTSPFTDESAFVVAYRFQPLLLLSWLVLIAAWPHDGESWSRSRIILASAAVLAAAAAKETWVVTPALVAALEYDRSRSWRAILTPTIMAGLAVGLYLVLYFDAFPTSKSYFELGPHIVAKVPSQLAAFFYLEESVPDGISLTWKGVVAAVMFMALVAGCVKWRVSGTVVAMVLLVVPTIPTMLVPYMPQRYLSIPYAGFLLVVALWMTAVGIRYERWRVAIRGVCAAAAGLVIVIGAATVRADLDDHRMMAGAHERLLSEAFDVRASVFEGAPVAVIRDEQTTPLLEIAQLTVGYPKLFFVRQDDPYGLIDAAALFEWVVADEAIHVEHVDDWVHECKGVGGRLLAHRNGGFVDLGVENDIATEASRWLSSGRRVRMIQTTP